MKDEDERRKRKSEKMGVKRLGRKSRTRLRCNMGEGEPRPLHTIIFVMYDGGGYNDKGCLDREYYILFPACCGLAA